MKKIEIIWREMLYQAIERRQNRLVQQELADKFKFSTSTVSHALVQLRRMGAVNVTGRWFVVQDAEKILYHWANYRNLINDIVYQTRIDLPVLEIEGMLPDGTIPTAYTAVRERFGEAPADYSQVYVYHQRPEKVEQRFPKNDQRPNLLVLKADEFGYQYEDTVTLCQLFVDLWNLTDWYAKPFVQRVKEEIDGLLS